MHIFYLFFARFMQFPVLDFGLDHSGSRPFNCVVLSKRVLKANGILLV